MLGEPAILSLVNGNSIVPTSIMHSKEEDRMDYNSDVSISQPSIDIKSIKALEEANRKELEKWAMLAGQAAFRLESFIFNEVLPKEICRPHVFPRSINDMESHIERCIRLEDNDSTLNNAKEKWKHLRERLAWTSNHRNVLLSIKKKYLNVPNPLEIVRELDAIDTRSYRQALKAFRTVLPTAQWKEGTDLVNMMMKLHLLHREEITSDRLL